jgi:hypothetical protein
MVPLPATRWSHHWQEPVPSSWQNRTSGGPMSVAADRSWVDQFALTLAMLVRMTVQIAVRMDDALAAQVKAAADDTGTNLSEWVRAAPQHQAALATSVRARAEDAQPRTPIRTARRPPGSSASTWSAKTVARQSLAWTASQAPPPQLAEQRCPRVPTSRGRPSGSGCPVRFRSRARWMRW